VPSCVLLSLLSEKALLSLRAKRGNLLARRSGLAENIAALPLAIRNDSESFKRCEIAKMQKGTMDSRLRGNDSLHPEGLKALYKQPLRGFLRSL
jgi:hypothetical protein